MNTSLQVWPSCPYNNDDAVRILFSHRVLFPLLLIPRMPCRGVFSLNLHSPSPTSSSPLLSSFLKTRLCSLSTHTAAEFDLLPLVPEADLLFCCVLIVSHGKPLPLPACDLWVLLSPFSLLIYCPGLLMHWSCWQLLHNLSLSQRI